MNDAEILAKAWLDMDAGHVGDDQYEEALGVASAVLTRKSPWIPVGERLPEVDLKVTAFSPSHGTEFCRCYEGLVVGTGRTQRGWVISCSGMPFFPTHWMPMPESPK